MGVTDAQSQFSGDCKEKKEQKMKKKTKKKKKAKDS